MKKFLTNISVYIFLVMSIYLIGRYIVFKRPKDYDSAFVDKLEILRSHKSETKIVLIGGSATGFGLSAEQLQQETGILSINLGHHAGFGLVDFMPFIQQNLSKNDIIIFSPEWGFFSKPDFVDEAILNHLIRYNPQYGSITGRPLYQLKSVFTAIDIHPAPDTGINKRIYTYDCINGNGDIISHCNVPALGPRRNTIDTSGFKIEKFEECFSFLKTHQTVIMFPPTQQIAYRNYSGYFNKIYQILKSRSYLLAGDIESNVYPDSAFFDEEYHLTCAQRTIRTKQVIDFLKSRKIVF